MIDPPKLYVPIFFLVFAALVIAIAWKVQLPDWLRFWLVVVGFVFGSAGVVTALNWIAYNSAARVRDLADARTYGARVMANAIRDMSSSKAEAILSMNQTYIEMIADEADPIFVVRTLDGVVPFDFVQEYLELSKTTDPYLYPERETSNWRWAASLTNLMIAKGWVEHGKGNMPAKRIKDMDYIARRFGVEL